MSSATRSAYGTHKPTTVTFVMSRSPYADTPLCVYAECLFSHCRHVRRLIGGGRNRSGPLFVEYKSQLCTRRSIRQLSVPGEAAVGWIMSRQAIGYLMQAVNWQSNSLPHSQQPTVKFIPERHQVSPVQLTSRTGFHCKRHILSTGNHIKSLSSLD